MHHRITDEMVLSTIAQDSSASRVNVLVEMVKFSITHCDECPEYLIIQRTFLDNMES